MINIDIAFLLDCQQLSLSSTPPTNGSYCPVTVNFTCVATDIPIALDWKINETTVVTYTVRDKDVFPHILPPTSSTPEDIEVIILTVSIEEFHVNITSVLTGNVTYLRGSTVQCSSPSQMLSSEIYYAKIQGKQTTC